MDELEIIKDKLKNDNELKSFVNRIKFVGKIILHCQGSGVQKVEFRIVKK